MEIAHRDKKRISYFLKDIVFHWLGAIYDPVQAISSIANESFILCFRPQRQSDFSKFVAQQIFSESLETLQVKAEKTRELLLSQGLPTEDANFSYDLEIAASYNSLAFIIKYYAADNAPEDFWSKIVDRIYLNIDSQSPSVRQSIYRLIGQLDNVTFRMDILLAQKALQDRSSSNYIYVLPVVLKFSEYVVFDNDPYLLDFLRSLLIFAPLNSDFRNAFEDFGRQISSNSFVRAEFLLRTLWSSLADSPSIFDKDRLKNYISLCLELCFCFAEFSFDQIIAEVFNDLTIECLPSISRSIGYAERIKLLQEKVPFQIFKVEYSRIIHLISQQMHVSLLTFLDEFIISLPAFALETSEHDLSSILVACNQRFSFHELLDLYCKLYEKYSDCCFIKQSTLEFISNSLDVAPSRLLDCIDSFKPHIFLETINLNERLKELDLSESMTAIVKLCGKGLENIIDHSIIRKAVDFCHSRKFMDDLLTLLNLFYCDNNLKYTFEVLSSILDSYNFPNLAKAVVLKILKLKQYFPILAIAIIKSSQIEDFDLSALQEYLSHLQKSDIKLVFDSILVKLSTFFDRIIFSNTFKKLSSFVDDECFVGCVLNHLNTINLSQKYLLLSELLEYLSKYESYIFIPFLEAHFELIKENYWKEPVMSVQQSKFDHVVETLLANHSTLELSQLLCLTDSDALLPNVIFRSSISLQTAGKHWILFEIWKKLILDCHIHISFPLTDQKHFYRTAYQLHIWKNSSAADFIDKKLDNERISLHELEQLLELCKISELALRSDHLNLLFRHLQKFDSVPISKWIPILSRSAQFLKEEFWMTILDYVLPILKIQIVCFESECDTFEARQSFLYVLQIIKALNGHLSISKFMDEEINIYLTKLIMNYSASKLSSLNQSLLSQQICNVLASVIKMNAHKFLDMFDLDSVRTRHS